MHTDRWDHTHDATLINVRVFSGKFVAGAVAVGLIGATVGIALGVAPPSDRDTIAPEKQAVLDQMDAQRATALAMPQPTSSNPQHILRREPTREPMVEGFFDYPSAWSPFTFRNVWKKHIGLEDVSVYAGVRAETLPPDFKLTLNQGVVLLITMNPGEWNFSGNGGYYPTPNRDGMLQITSADGNVLTLRAEDGATFTFDVVSRRLAETLPGTPIAVTPSPVAQPTGIATSIPTAIAQPVTTGQLP